LVASDEVRRFITGSYGDSQHDGFVLDICHQIVEHYLSCGVDVIYDATNPTPEVRASWVNMARRLGIAIKCVWIDAPLDICLVRNSCRENVVPEIVIRRILGRFIPPSSTEGFDEIHHLHTI
jgi:bifunctional polynucleotide phosphatase/kinase